MENYLRAEFSILIFIQLHCSHRCRERGYLEINGISGFCLLRWKEVHEKRSWFFCFLKWSGHTSTPRDSSESAKWPTVSRKVIRLQAPEPQCVYSPSLWNALYNIQDSFNSHLSHLITVSHLKVNISCCRPLVGTFCKLRDSMYVFIRSHVYQGLPWWLRW